MESIMTSLRLGVAVVDPDLRIQLWNRQAEDLWGVRAAETQGQSLLDLDIGLPVAELADPVRACLAGKDGASREVVVTATNRRGKSIQCRIQCTALMSRDGKPAGAVLVMEEVAAVPAGRSAR
jgi:two-component system CheB/CheR fusion protein